MKKVVAVALSLLMLLSVGVVASAQSAEAIDVTGFWYSEDDGSGIELYPDGAAIITNDEGETVGEGTYTADGPNVTITAGDTHISGVVTENSLDINAGERTLIRDGIEVGYWYNYNDESSYELGEGRVWSYNAEGDLLGEGSYTVDGNTVTIEMKDGKTLTAVVEDAIMTIDAVEYNLL